MAEGFSDQVDQFVLQRLGVFMAVPDFGVLQVLLRDRTAPQLRAAVGVGGIEQEIRRRQAVRFLRPLRHVPTHRWRHADEIDLAFSADSWGCLRAWPCLALESRPLWEVPAAHDGWIDLSR